MANLKQIKAKIKSVGNLKKITRALEVVSTIKLQKIKSQTDGLKAFLIQILHILSKISPQINPFGSNQVVGTPTKNAIVVMSSERGLCGGLNTKLLRKVVQEHDIANTDFFVVGKKGLEFLKRAHASIVGHIQLGDSFSSHDLLPLYVFFEDAIQKGTYQKVSLYFNFFKNSITQIPTSIQIFPLSLHEIKMFFNDIDIPFPVSGSPSEFDTEELLIEPTLEEVRKEMRRQIRNYVIVSALVQNKTGEHAARMIAMKSAKDNATGFVKALTLKFNKERQGAITKEISEIVSAKIAIEG